MKAPGIRPEILWCPNPPRGKAGKSNGWKFPRAVERQIIADHDGQSVLHLFGGLSRFGVRLDVDPVTRPDVLGDAWLPPFGKDSFDVVVLDPPYFHLNAQQKNALFRAAGWIARKRVIWFHTIWVSASMGLQLERAFMVRVGDSCAARVLQYFHSNPDKPGPVNRFRRGPAMKYNRWLVQPQGFAFEPVRPRKLAPPPESPQFDLEEKSAN